MGNVERRFFGPLLYLREYSVEFLFRNLRCHFSSQSRPSTTLEGSIFIDIRINRISPKLGSNHGDQCSVVCVRTVLQTVLFGLFILTSYVALYLLISLYDAIVFLAINRLRPGCSDPVMIVTDIIIDDIPSGILCVSLLQFIWSSSSSDIRQVDSLNQGKMGIALKTEADFVDTITISSTVVIHTSVHIGWFVSKAVHSLVSCVNGCDSTKRNSDFSLSAPQFSICLSHFRMALLSPYKQQRRQYVPRRITPEYTGKKCSSSSSSGSRLVTAADPERHREINHPGKVGSYLLVIYLLETYALPRQDGGNGDEFCRCGGSSVSGIEPRYVLDLIWLAAVHLMRSSQQQQQQQQRSLDMQSGDAGAMSSTKSVKKRGLKMQKKCEVVVDRQPGDVSCGTTADHCALSNISLSPFTGDASVCFSLQSNMLQPTLVTQNLGVEVFGSCDTSHNSYSNAAGVASSSSCMENVSEEALPNHHDTTTNATLNSSRRGLNVLSLSAIGLRVNSIGSVVGAGQCSPTPVGRRPCDASARKEKFGIELLWDVGYVEISL